MPKAFHYHNVKSFRILYTNVYRLTDWRKLNRDIAVGSNVFTIYTDKNMKI